MSIAPIDEPLDVQIVEGEVVLAGPNGINGSLTMEAARETVRRLAAALGEDDAETYQKPLG